MIILHLVQDEKFIDFFSAAMNATTGARHRFVVHTENPNATLKHIKTTVPFRRVSDAYFRSQQMADDLKAADVLVVHFLTKYAATMIKAAGETTRVVWSGWGGDYYYLIDGSENSLHGPETRAILKSLDNSGFGKLKHLLEPLKSVYRYRTRILPVLRRVDFFSSPLPNEFALLKEKFNGNFHAKFVQLNYGSVEANFVVGNVVNNGNILIGNSATPSNNHVEAFGIVQRLDLSDRKVIVPLSYGNPRYRDAVLKAGQSMLGDRFEPILDFVPLAKYNDILSTCTLAIMNHYRQQALGNIGALLYQGRKVYLNANNAAYHFLRDRGAQIFDIADLGRGQEKPFEPLDPATVKRNRQVMEDFWGTAQVEVNAQNFIDLVSARHETHSLLNV